MKYSHDLVDNRFDRSYEYDHVGRLTKALSGPEARGEPITEDRPYWETATYDAFNHLNVRATEHWSKHSGLNSSDTYVNNRRVGWTYDANGNWLSGAGRQHTYSAAGRTSTTTWTGGYFNEFSDGDGRRVKAVESNLVTYYLRSTVLGGQVVEELTSSGAKQKSMIYGGDQVIGYDWANGNVSMLHQDPSGMTIRSSIPQSPYVGYFSELDPWGAEVFLWDPYLDDPGFDGGRGESGPTYGGFGDISMPSTGCMLDGVYTLCDFINRNSEALALQITEGGKTKQIPLKPGLLGIFAAWVEDAGQKLNKPQTPVDVDVSPSDVIVTNTDDDGLGHFELVIFDSNNPYKDQNKDCSIEVRFSGRIRPGTPRFDDGPNHTKLGPYIGSFYVFTDYSFRFEVTGYVTDGKIGHIGERDLKNGGEWTITQLIEPLAGSNLNGKPARDIGKTIDDSPKYLKQDNAGTVTVAVNGGTFAWHDGPGFLGDKDHRVVSAKLDANFSVAVTNGNRGCQVGFHIRASFENGVWRATIGPGYLGSR